MSVSDRQASYWFLMRITIGLIPTCVTVGLSYMSKFTEGSCQGSFAVNNERAIRTLKPSSEQKNAMRESLQGRNLLVNLPTGFPASSNRCRCTAAYSAI